LKILKKHTLYPKYLQNTPVMGFCGFLAFFSILIFLNDFHTKLCVQPTKNMGIGINTDRYINNNTVSVIQIKTMEII